MLDSLFSSFAPHYCFSCGDIGAQICDNCFFDIDLSPRQTCLSCHGLLINLQCRSCHQLSDVSQIVLAERHGILERLIDEYKFTHTRGSYKLIARLFDEYAPIFPTSAHIIPIPTSSPHIRARGFDHTRDIAARFAKLRDLRCTPLFKRRHNLAQVGVSAATRRAQAATAFSSLRRVPDSGALYVVCDDIVTTGASVSAAIEKLRLAGAQNLAILALLQQPWK